MNDVKDEVIAAPASDRLGSLDSTSGSDDQLAAALQEVCSALEAGESLDRTELLAKYPNVRDELASCLDNLDFINNVAPQLADGKATTAPTGVSSGSPFGRPGW